MIIVRMVFQASYGKGGELAAAMAASAKQVIAEMRQVDALVRWEDRSRPYVTATTTLPRLCPLSTYLCASTMLSRA
jgi:hypothetical protein